MALSLQQKTTRPLLEGKEQLNGKVGQWCSKGICQSRGTKFLTPRTSYLPKHADTHAHAS